MSATRGRCLCGGVQFRVNGPLRPVVYCHCKMCRRTSGHILAATACALPHLSIDQSESLRWYESSAHAKRGFCSVCGSNLFWKPASGTYQTKEAPKFIASTIITKNMKHYNSHNIVLTRKVNKI